MIPDSYELSQLLVRKPTLALTRSVNPKNAEIIDAEFIEDIDNRQVHLTLSDMFNEFAPFPSQTCLLGLCDDGMPLMLDLGDPRTCSILIISENKSWIRSLIKFVLRSLIEINHPDVASFALISPDREDWEDEIYTPHCLVNYSPYQREASELLMSLCGVVEQRKSGRQLGPAILLIFDELIHALSPSFDQDISVHFRWLIENGPNANVFTIAGLSPDEVNPNDHKTLSCFRRKIADRERSSLRLPVATYGSESSRSYPLTIPQFGYQAGSQLIRFTIPRTSG